MIRKEHYAIAFLMTTLVFIIGIFIGSEISTQHTETLQEQLQRDILETQNFELELALLERVDAGRVCSYIETRLPDLIKRKVELGRLFDTEGVPADQANILESQFVSSLVRFYLFTQLQEDKCNIRKPSILFFFDGSEQSREQARVLDNIVYSLSDENITVFAFNKRFENTQTLIALLYRLNTIDVLPTIVIGNNKYEGFQSKDTVTGLVCADFGDLPIC